MGGRYGRTRWFGIEAACPMIRPVTGDDQVPFVFADAVTMSTMGAW
jgi:hypothetical protein